MNINSICAHWVALHEALGVGAPIADEAHYAKLLEIAERLMERAAAEEASPYHGLLELIAQRIREYEDKAHPWPDASTPASILKFLMEQHGLSQSQLPEIGSQGVVSELLRGKRTLNVRQIQALSERFSVGPEVFLSRGEAPVSVNRR